QKFPKIPHPQSLKIPPSPTGRGVRGEEFEIQLPNPNEILEKIKRKGADQAEVYFSSSSALKIDVIDQKVESIDKITDIGIGIRIIKDKKLGFAFTSEFDETILGHTTDWAINNANNSAADENWCMPEKSLEHRGQGIELFDEKIASTTITQKTELALKIEEAAHKYDKRVKKTEKVTYSDSEQAIWIVNSNGLDAQYKSNHCGAIAMVMAIADGHMESGMGMDYVKKLADLNAVEIGKEAAQKAVELLNPKPIKSQKLPILLDPISSAELLEVLVGPLSAEAVQKGKSLFANKIGRLAAANKIKIIDDGTLENRIGTAPFDDEGTLTQKTVLIEDGILTNYIHNAYTAKKGNAKSTGNAARSGYRTLPAIGPTNLYIEPGNKAQSEMIKSINKGLLVVRLMGIHTINPISGDFSIGAAGLMIDNGEITYPVRGITIAGNIIDMLEAVEEVGSDLRFMANIGAPSLLIGNISISGE
ncbi:MAG: TldD/PmbA family protein, partial [Candidatus Margulisbacteria bacterium]|nr:TldD/PmbA family protein [Candidatus Margulisiibacteriota bacterium]